MKHIRFCQDLINFVERGHGHSSEKKVDIGGWGGVVGHQNVLFSSNAV